MVPLIVEGPWHDLDYRPDLAGLAGKAASDPGRLLESAKGLKSGGAGAVKDVLGGVTGGGAASPPAAKETTGKASPSKLSPLRKLLGN